MYKSNMVTAVILAAGCGRRIGAGKNKLLLKISGKSILSYTLNVFDKNPYVDHLVIVAAENEMDFISNLAANEINEKTYSVIKGGKERSESSYFGVKEAKDGIVMIHDGARPFCSRDIIQNVLEGVFSFGAAAPGILVVDTIKKVEDGFIKETVKREELVRIQTPQAFFRKEILNAHEEAERKGEKVTDDCMLFEKMGKKIKVVDGSEENIKITTREDIKIAERILESKKEA